MDADERRLPAGRVRVSSQRASSAFVGVHLWLLCAVVLLAAGCETYRVEYHTRPAYYREAAMGGLPDRVRLDDGTVLVYNTRDLRGKQQRRAVESDGERREFKIREELDDGSIVLRALMPEHVIANTLECLRNEEYELLYEQMLSELTRLEWEGRGMDVDDFADFFSDNRREMMRTLQRIYIGMSQLDVVIEHLDQGVLDLRLRREAARGHRFTRVRVIREGYGMKLLTIR